MGERKRGLLRELEERLKGRKEKKEEKERESRKYESRKYEFRLYLGVNELRWFRRRTVPFLTVDGMES